MSNHFQCQNCGQCCGIIPVTYGEWKMIRRAIKRMSLYNVRRLENQQRGEFTCLLRDIENKRCSIYDSRPTLCKLQGTQKGLPCPYQPQCAVGTDGREKLDPEVYGVLGRGLGWPELKQGLHEW